MEEAIRVCIRQRPLFQREIEAGHTRAWKLSSDGTVTLEITPPQGIPLKKSYAFDLCFDESCNNDVVYEKTARDIVRDTAKGINGCYMAYGQTGCGKTHSIMGTAQDPGILPRAVAELFDIVEEGNGVPEEEYQTEYLIRVTYVEIYLERVNDLFQDGPKGESQPLENLDVKEDPKGGFYVVGLAEREVSSVDDVMKLLQSAEMKRHFARTNFNETSSRSHTVFTTIMESTLTYPDGSAIVRRGELKLVDLAGNERASAAEGIESAKERQAEGQAINKSLFLLSEVIAKLSKRAELLKKGATDKADKMKKEMMHIPWRDSKLTRLLQKALGGNSRACLLVAVHPSTQALEISLSTLRFALKAKQIKKKIVQNFVSPEQSLIMQQKETIKMLQAQLAALQEMTGVTVSEELKEQITKTMAPGQKSVIGSAETNEAIQKLKNELEQKVNSLSKIILRAKFEVPKAQEEENDTESKLKRSVTITGVRGRFERLQTLPVGLKNQLYQPVPAHVGASETSRLGSIASTMVYLQTINEMNRADSESEQKQEAKARASTELARYDTVKLDHLIEDTEAQQMNNQAARRRITALKIGNSRLVKKNRVAFNQINYLRSLLNKLGLSVFMAGTEVTDERGQPQLGYDLAALTIPEELPASPCHDQHLDMYLNKIQPLAYAMAARVLSCGVDRHIRGGDDKETDDDTVATVSSDSHSQNTYGKIDSVFALLRPWEQHILAILFEQKELHQNMERATNEFKDTIRDLRKRVQVLMAEKIELVEHSTRLIDELRFYRYETVPRSDAAATETFARLTARINSLQADYAEKVSELKLLRAKLDLERDNTTMRQRLFSFDLDVIPEDLSVHTLDEDKKKLLHEAMFSRHIAGLLRMQLLEARSFEEDLRKVNSELWRELKTARAACGKAINAQKLAEFELRNERVALQKRVEALYNAQLDSQTECEMLRRQLDEMKKELQQRSTAAGSADETIANDTRHSLTAGRVTPVRSLSPHDGVRSMSATPVPRSPRTPRALTKPTKSTARVGGKKFPISAKKPLLPLSLGGMSSAARQPLSRPTVLGKRASPLSGVSLLRPMLGSQRPTPQPATQEHHHEQPPSAAASEGENLAPAAPPQTSTSGGLSQQPVGQQPGQPRLGNVRLGLNLPKIARTGPAGRKLATKESMKRSVAPASSMRPRKYF